MRKGLQGDAQSTAGLRDEKLLRWEKRVERESLESGGRS